MKSGSKRGIVRIRTWVFLFAVPAAPAFAASPCGTPSYDTSPLALLRSGQGQIRFTGKGLSAGRAPVEVVAEKDGSNFSLIEWLPLPYADPSKLIRDNSASFLTFMGDLCGQTWLSGSSAGPSLPGAPQAIGPLPASGQASQAIAVADLNGDGIPDSVQLNIATGALVVQLLSQQNTVVSTNTAQPGFTPSLIQNNAVVIADFNGDGKPDLAVSYYGSGTGAGGALFILLGNGDGTFGAPKSFNAGATPVSLAVADFNGDGKLDIAAANVTAGTVSVLLGNGDGTFGAPTAYSTGEDQNGAPKSILALDLNGDGVPDLAVANGSDNSVSALLNAGGKFGQPIVTPTPLDAQYLAYSDFDHDGNPDLVVACVQSSAMMMLLGKGNGAFQPGTAYAVGTNPDSIGVIPFADGHTALVLPDQFSAESLAILVTPQGQVGAAPYNFVGISPASSLSAVSAVDLNGDDQPDVVTAESYSSTPIAVMLSQGGTQFKAPVKYALAPNPLCSPCAGPAAMAIGDFNGDGKPDVLVGNAGFPNTVTEGLVNVLLGNGDGTLKGATVTALPSGSPVGQYPSQIFATGDFNRDGKLDVAVAAYGAAPDGSGAGSVIVLTGNGDGTFRTPVIVPAPNGLHPVAVAAADFNGDGILDLAAALVDKDYSRNPETLAIFLGQANGAFAAAKTFALQSKAGAAGAIAIGDLNGDGKPDIAVSSDYAGSDLIDVLLGDGAGGFQEVGALPGTAFYAPIPLAIADVDGDGNADIVAGGPEGAVFLGFGNGTFQAEQYFSSGPVAGMAATRFSGSSGPGLVIANPAGTWVSKVNNFLPAALSIIANVSAANAALATVAPASFASAFGVNLAAGIAQPAPGTLPITLGGTTVNIHDAAGVDHAAPLSYVSPQQVNYVIPDGTAIGKATITITSAGGLSGSIVTPVASIAPGIFPLNVSGLVAAIVLTIGANASVTYDNVYQVDSSGNIVPLPVDLSAGQVYLELYGTGIRNARTVTATVGGVNVPLYSFGAQGTYLGLDQINIGPLPASLKGSGQANIVVTADGQPANTVNITFR